MTPLDRITAATAEAHAKHGHDFEESSLADRMLIVGDEDGDGMDGSVLGGEENS